MLSRCPQGQRSSLFLWSFGGAPCRPYSRTPQTKRCSRISLPDLMYLRSVCMSVLGHIMVCWRHGLDHESAHWSPSRLLLAFFSLTLTMLLLPSSSLDDYRCCSGSGIMSCIPHVTLYSVRNWRCTPLYVTVLSGSFLHLFFFVSFRFIFRAIVCTSLSRLTSLSART